jgi:hypothetical protein
MRRGSRVVAATSGAINMCVSVACPDTAALYA